VDGVCVPCGCVHACGEWKKSSSAADADVHTYMSTCAYICMRIVCVCVWW